MIRKVWNNISWHFHLEFVVMNEKKLWRLLFCLSFLEQPLLTFRDSRFNLSSEELGYDSKHLKHSLIIEVNDRHILCCWLIESHHSLCLSFTNVYWYWSLRNSIMQIVVSLNVPSNTSSVLLDVKAFWQFSEIHKGKNGLLIPQDNNTLDVRTF